ncbi:MAG TPA: DUF5666 domain-containing protein [Anaeromyxobacter sp.]|nr:DUF5666 domain-containing protein [Anaeromyxobacter sp.]
MLRNIRTVVSFAAALALAACGGGARTPSNGASAAPKVRVTRGAISARSAGSVTVNGIQLSTASSAVRADGKSIDQASLDMGMVVTVRGTFDDRGGEASEIEMEHAVEGRIDDKGVDFVVVGGQRVHVDDSTEFHQSRSAGLASYSVGDVIAVSGVADDRGGLRSSRIDDSPRQVAPAASHDDFDLQGFVSNIVAGTSFELRITPDASERWIVTIAGLTMPAGFKDGARVEVHSLSAPAAGTAPVLGIITASAVDLEDRLDDADDQGELEIEGIVTSGAAASFVIDGKTVLTDASTKWLLGLSTDLVPGVKVEAEGQVDGSGALHATKVSFRAGVRITAALQNVSWDGTSGTATILGVPVQLPSFARYDVAPAEGLRVELRGNPSASGTGVVALRLMAATGGNTDRVFIRAVVTSESSARLTILGFDVTTAGAQFKNVDESLMSADAFFAAVDAGRTVVKARAASLSNVAGTSFAADEVEIDGDE